MSWGKRMDGYMTQKGVQETPELMKKGKGMNEWI
jgi:hypothetical protein